MASYVLDKAYKVAATDGVGAHLLVAPGSTAGECDLPAGANDGPILGATVHSAQKDQSVAVRKLGIASITAAGTINVGDQVCAADDQGRIKSAAKASADTGVEGNNNAVTWTARKPGSQGNNIQVDVVVSGTGTSLSIAVSGNKVTINSATDGGGSATTTAAQAISAVADDANASQLIEGADKGSSDGSGAVADETVTLSGGELGDRAFGIAEQAASAQGDIIDVFLTI